MSEITIRPMVPEDWDDVARIYLEGIATEHATFQTDFRPMPRGTPPTPKSVGWSFWPTACWPGGLPCTG